MEREVVSGIVTPHNDREAKASPEWPQWKAALEREQLALLKMGTFELVKRSKMEARGKKTKGVKVVYKLKRDKDGNLDKYKCRLVVQGFNLHPNNEYHERHSSVLTPTTLRLLAYVETQTGEKMSSADIGNAFIEADLSLIHI